MGRVKSPVYPEFYTHVQTAYVHCGSGLLYPRIGRVNNPLGTPCLSHPALIKSYQCRDNSYNVGEKTIIFMPLKQKLGRLKHHCNVMGELMAALVKYADSDSTMDPEPDEEKPGKGKKSSNTKGQHHNPANQGATVSTRLIIVWILWQTPTRRIMASVIKGKPNPRFRGPNFNLEEMLNQPCPKHGTQENPAAHLWKDCFIMREYRKNSEQSWAGRWLRSRLSRSGLRWRHF